ncbi:hypothetical protein P3X46_005113 [Hevea brasiliensis]|uniref:Retrotransposon gag domain-containing protein n=1 Tax=Hevea brasiliensis TaxID=3981 RepID=A0ABQ9N1D9_HEVBR|nr:hypothetical protein P3X46_005113 [Hevea brasiliensis]
MTNIANDYLQNPSNPFFLHPNENPVLFLVSPARAMRMSLLSKNKIKFIDGTMIVPPVTDLMYPAWERCNMMGDIFRISDLQEEIYGFKKGDLSVTKYFTELKILWEELLNFQPIPVCSCPNPCSCGAIGIFETYQRNDYVIHFLKGLNDRFANVGSQIMLLDSLPSINKVFSLIVQQERQMDLGEDFSSKALVNTKYQFNKNFSGNSSNVKVCTYCGKQRHTVDTCYKKHGFPPGYKFKNSGSSTNQVTVEDQPLEIQIIHQSKLIHQVFKVCLLLKSRFSSYWL